MRHAALALTLLALSSDALADDLIWVREPHAESAPAVVLDVLARADKVTVFALNPMTPGSPPFSAAPGTVPEFLLEVYPVIGKASVRDSRQIGEIAAALKKGLQGAGASACFYPRHAVRAEAGRRKVDLVICFECNETIVIVSDEVRGRVRTDDSALAVLARVLKSNGITPLEPKNEGFE